MTLTRRQGLGALGAAAVAAAWPRAARAEAVHEVRMLNNHPEDPSELMVFVPDLVRAAPGDTIRFLAVDRNHNSQSYDDMLPARVAPWKSDLGEDFDLVVGEQGAYGYYCTPHRSLGMVGLILVGDVSGNYQAVKDVRLRGKAGRRFDDIFARADAMLAGEA